MNNLTLMKKLNNTNIIRIINKRLKNVKNYQNGLINIQKYLLMGILILIIF